MNHENDTEAQKKQGSNRQNIHFCSLYDSRYRPEEGSESVSDTDNPSEIERSNDEPQEYTESYISTTDPAWEIIELLYRGDYPISFLFSEERFHHYPKREKEGGEQDGGDIVIFLLRN